MKKLRADRENVLCRKHAITIALSENGKREIEEKAMDMGLSVSALARMAIKEFLKNH